MAFTRFSSDSFVQQKKLEESTFSGIYHLNTPGNGLENSYIENPRIRLQKWGANLRTNSCNLESELKGLNKPLNRDNVNYKDVSFFSKNHKYESNNNFNIDETRATLPAWKYRELPQQRYDFVFDNPQKHVFKPFTSNLNTRQLEKDFYDKNKN
jgi:hypothetical protein